MATSIRANATFVSRKQAPAPRAARIVVRAEAAEAPAKEAKPAWTAPTLDPNTPSPIFGGSTGGLLRKAQVWPSENAMLTALHCWEALIARVPAVVVIGATALTCVIPAHTGSTLLAADSASLSMEHVS